jgi:predicted nucleotide-binding protein
LPDEGLAVIIGHSDLTATPKCNDTPRETDLTDRVFIGSSNEARKNLAEPVADFLAKEGYTVERWWELFRPGRYTISDLIRCAKDVDAAIFVFSADDYVSSREAKVTQPRDNVLLEWGLFVGLLGPERTLVIAAPDVKLPSDISGLTVIRMQGDIQATANVAASTIGAALREARQARDPELTIRCDIDVVDKSVTLPPPKSWLQRSLFYGPDGARGWLEVVGHQSYPSGKSYKNNQHPISNAISGLKASTFVSLGPGGGEADRRILQRLKISDPTVSYIPVDISDALLARATREAKKVANVPVALWTDFEDSLHFVERQLANYARRPVLIAMLGNTFGNLDQGETNLLEGVASILHPSEHFLLEVSCVADDWTRAQDERSSAVGWSPYYKLLSVGISRRTNEAESVVLKEIDKRLRITSGRTEVPDSHCFSVSDTMLVNYTILGDTTLSLWRNGLSLRFLCDL